MQGGSSIDVGLSRSGRSAERSNARSGRQAFAGLLYRVDGLPSKRLAYRPWLCENAGAGSLTDLDCSAAKLGEVCEHIFPISSSTQPDAAPRIVSAPGPARAAKVRAHHALTAAIIGLTPKIFSTRVKL